LDRSTSKDAELGDRSFGEKALVWMQGFGVRWLNARSRRAGVAGAALAGLWALSPLPAASETLQQALASAYLLNPTLNAQRATLRATDEDVSIAKSGLRPEISGSAQKSYLNENATTNIGSRSNVLSGLSYGNGQLRPFSYGVTLTQPIFQGFQNLNAIRGAKSSVQAGRETLRYTEEEILLQSATAYVDVVQDEAIVRLNENNVHVLAEQLKQTRDRFDVGEVTRTDVAQAEARHADALSQLSTAQANLKSARATYEQLIGHPPENLIKPGSILNRLPRTLDQAMTIGDAENPQILSAVYAEEADLYQVQKLTGQLLPQVSLEASYAKDTDPTFSVSKEETTTVTGRLTVPFYQGGAPSAEIRQAKEDDDAAKRDVEAARLTVHADVISAWGVLQSTAAEIQSAESSVRANKIALAGVREEALVGQRTTLDVLNAQLEYLQSQINLVTAIRDRVVAEYTLFASIGRMDAQTLGLNVPYYDPLEHYDRVKNKWFGLRPPSPPLPDQ
jgi:outer membrane protein